MRFLHRNGETDTPTEDGFYWFQGEMLAWFSDGESVRRWCIDGPVQIFRSFHTHLPLCLINVRVVEIERMRGQWWGPLPLPEGTGQP